MPDWLHSIRRSFQETAEEKSARQESVRRGKLQELREAVTGLVEDLEMLAQLPGSRFKYEISEHKDQLRITTNIPRKIYGLNVRGEDPIIRIDVKKLRNGTIRFSAKGDDRYNGLEVTSQDQISSNGDTAPIAKFIVDYAMTNGLTGPKQSSPSTPRP